MRGMCVMCIVRGACVVGIAWCDVCGACGVGGICVVCRMGLFICCWFTP